MHQHFPSHLQSGNATGRYGRGRKGCVETKRIILEKLEVLHQLVVTGAVAAGGVSAHRLYREAVIGDSVFFVAQSTSK
jgi:hypothetical protein